MTLESKFQHKLINELQTLFPGCIVLKNDPNYKQGIPDLTVLYNKKWATLEVKRSQNSPCRPNQHYYVSIMNDMSFSSFVYPENKEEVLNALQHTFRS